MFLCTWHAENLFKIWKSQFPLLVPCLMLSYVMFFVVKGWGTGFSMSYVFWEVSVVFMSLWCHQECSILSALLHCGVPEMVPCESPVLLVTPSKPLLISRVENVDLFPFYITSNRTNWGRQILFFNKENYSVLSVGGNLQGLRTDYLHSTEKSQDLPSKT